MRPLAELLAGIPHHAIAGDLNVAVGGIRVDSRLVEAGDLFVCLPGYQSEGGETRADRHEFLPEALARGAVALVVDRPVTAAAAVTVVRTPDCWQAIASIACEYYRQPSHQMTVVGITGTSGKTSTSYFVEAVLAAAGGSTACFGTIEYRIAGRVLPAQQTTPEAIELQGLLRQAADSGCRAVVMEVSSHALELRRVAGVEFDIGVFTNLSQDHLNFHPDMEHYLRAKARLFEQLGSGGKRATAVINRDDRHSTEILAANRAAAVLTFGVEQAADVSATALHSTLAGTCFRARTSKGEFEVRLQHLGDYQVYNALAAIAVGIALDLEPEVIRRALESAPPIPGRFELVDCGQPFRVAVDYAHKPDALERLLRSARSLQPKRIITVFGCGGDRDRGKRALMGRIATQLSDLTIITSDNPRGEPPAAIIAEIEAGARSVAGAAVVLEPDRSNAIALAIAQAEPDDIVLIAGKGHETYQLFAERRIHFDDREQARAALARR